MYGRVEIALRWSIALGLLGWGLVRTMIVPLGSPLLVFSVAVVAGPFVVGASRTQLRLLPRDVTVLRRQVAAVGSVLAVALTVLVGGLVLDANGARQAGALLTAAGLAAMCAVVALAVCRLWRGGWAPGT